MIQSKPLFSFNFLCFQKLKKGIMALVVLLLNLNAFSQKSDSIQLEEVEIIAIKTYKIPALQSQKISDKILQTSSTQSIGEVLKNNSTVFIKDYGPSNIQTPTFRGMSASHTKIYVNGLDISPGSLGQSDLNILPSYLFDGVELKYGNTSFSEGPGAIGGGIMLSTNNTGRGKGSAGNIGLSLGSFGAITAQGEYAFTGEKWRSVTRYIFQDAKNDFEYRNVAQKDFPTQTQEHGEKRQNGIMQSLMYSPNWKNFFDVMILGTFTDRNLPALMTSTSPSKETQNDNLFTAQLGWKNYIPQGMSKLVVGYTHNKLHYQDPDAGINSTTINQRIQVREDFVKKWNDKWSSKVMGLFEYSEANNPNYGGKANMIQGSVLAGVKGNPLKKWEFGVYIQPTWNNDDFELIPMASLAFMPLGNGNLTFGLNVSKNAHFPTLNDLYWFPGGNPDLQPEKSTSGEFNIHNEGGLFKWLQYEVEIATFMGTVDNWILWQPTDKSYWEAQNIKSVDHSGVDASLKLSKKWKNWNATFQSSYQFVNAINKDVEDESLNKQLIYTPQNIANWLFRVDYKNYWIQSNYTFTGIRYITTSNSAYLPSYDLVNLSVGLNLYMIRTGKILLQFDVNNVFGKEYMSVAYRSMPGTNFNFSLKYLFK